MQERTASLAPALLDPTREGIAVMQTIAGIFRSRVEAERTAVLLEAIGIAPNRITVLSPGTPTDRVPTDEGEAPGTGAAIGAVVGGATGAAVGLPLGAAMTFMLPGIGPVIAMGMLGAALFGAGGAAAGSALEQSLVNGVPRDERLAYEAALRSGCSVVVALEEDADRAAEARRIVDEADGERPGEAAA
jgi:hypothetical protein